METKKSIVRSAIYKKSFSGQFGEGFIHEITFDNNDKGDYISKSNPQTSFVVGKESDYTIEEKQNGNYKNYTIKPVKQQNGFVPGKGNPAYEHKRTALRCAVDLVAAGKIEVGKIKEYSESFMKFLNE
jgi:hypothetical protein